MTNHITTKPDLGILLLRLFVGLRLIYGAVDNIVSWKRVLEFEEFLLQNGFPFPLVCALVSVYAQFIAGLMILIGFKIRMATLVMIFNFFVAIAFVHIRNSDSIERTTPAYALFFGSLALLFLGAGNYSIDKRNRVGNQSNESN